ncbi:MAG: hypothetical protein HKO03_01730 [Acidimicrobiia bacterium]|nr:hypothetical protein [Acidimicrobiia bacterium]
MKKDQAFVKKLDQDYLMCRTLRHSWDQEYFGIAGDHVMDARLASRFAPGVIVRILRCSRCECERFDFYRRREFRAFYHRYIHPEAYLYRMTKGVERPVSTDYTKEAFRRATG